MLAQREMESTFSVSMDSAPLAGRGFQGMGVYRPMTLVLRGNQKTAKEQGLDQLSMEEIDAEIAAARKRSFAAD